MLKHFGSGANIDAVLGDLAEQYHQKDNAMWYWRQAMKAIPVTLFRETWAHKGIAARALLVGWGMWVVYVMLVLPLLTSYFLGDNLAVGIESRDLIGTAWSVLWAPVLIQVSAGRPFSFVFALVLPLVVWAMCGWLVARLHRRQQRATVCLFAASIVLANALLLTQLALRVGPVIASQHLAVPLAANIVVSFLGFLIGGGILRDSSVLAKQD
jgi:hypothetical protein